MWLSKTLSRRFCIVLAVVAAALPTAAQMPGRSGMLELGVRPQLVKLTGGPGGRHSFELHLRNYSRSKAITVHLDVNDAVQQMNGSLRFVKAGEGAYSASDWMDIANDRVTIPANSERTVLVQLQIPAQTDAAGDYTSIISVSGQPAQAPLPRVAAEDELAASTRVRVVFGVIVHVTVAGPRTPKARVEAIRFADRPQTGSGQTAANSKADRWLVARFHNEGNTMLRGYGWVALRDPDGRLLQRWQIGQRDGVERLLIYPGRRVETYLPITRPLVAGEYEVEVRLTYDRGKIAVAKVKATLEKAGKDQLTARVGQFTPLTIGLAVTVDSELKKLTVARGAVRTEVVGITNEEPNPIRVRGNLYNVRMEPDGTLLPHRLDDADPASITNWLRMHRRSFTLFPGETRKVQFAVAVPRDGELSKDLAGLIRFEAHELDVVRRERSVEVVGEAGVLVLASFRGTGERDIEIGVPALDVRPELNGQIRLSVPLVNTGDVALEPGGTLEFVGVSNPELLWSRPLFAPGASPLILPEAKRLIWITLPRQAFKVGEYQGKILLNYGAGKPTTRTFQMNLMGDPADNETPPAAAGDDTPDEPAANDEQDDQ